MRHVRPLVLLTAAVLLAACGEESRWSPTPVGKTEDHGSKVIASAVSDDGRLIATADLDARIVVRRMADGTEVVRFDDRSSRRIVHLAFLPLGDRLLSATQTTLRVYDPETGRRVSTIPTGLRTHENDFIAVTGRGPSRRVKGTWVDGTLNDVGVSADGRWIVAYLSAAKKSRSGLRVWDAVSSQPRSEKKAGIRPRLSPSEPRVAVQSRSGTRVLALPSLKGVWRASTGHPIGYSADGSHLFVSDRRAGTLTVHDAADGAVRLEIDSAADEAAFSPDGKTLVYIAGLEAVGWDVASAAELWRLPVYKTEASPSMAMLSAPAGVLLVSQGARDPKVRLTDVRTGRLLGGIDLPPSALSMLRMTGDGSHLAIGVFKGKTNFYRL